MTKKIKKKSNQREDNIKRRVGNKWLYYMINGLGSYVLELMKMKTPKDSKKIGTMIYFLFKKNKIPMHWAPSVVKLVTKPKISEPPDHEYLSLKIGSHYIQSSNFNKEKIKKMKGQEFTIAINGRVKKTEIKEFLDRHSDIIDEIYESLDLQETKYLGDPTFNEHLLTALVKNKPNIALKEIFDFVNEGIDDSTDYSRTRGRVRNSDKLDVS